MALVQYMIQRRRRHLVNTDPQRRCYEGCFISSKLVWLEWEDLEGSTTQEKADSRLKFWTELNDYAVSQRGAGAKCEFRVATQEFHVVGEKT